MQHTKRGLHSHLAIEQGTSGPVQSPAQDIFFSKVLARPAAHRMNAFVH